MGVEIGMKTQTFTIFASNETGIIGKIAQLKVCILNYQQSQCYRKHIKRKSSSVMALSEDVSYLVHTVDNDLISIGDLNTDDSEAIESLCCLMV